ncbi:aldo/keto reductase, partial [Salmonella enterica subsp. enterica serovar Panama]|nr:aldo/keto reductase [Salmonella enterica subsp. enterica serovar Panama]
ADKLEKVRQLNELAARRGQKLSQMALAWVLRNDNVTSVLIGASKPSQIEDAVGMLANRRFSAAECAEIDAILKGRF